MCHRSWVRSQTCPVVNKIDSLVEQCRGKEWKVSQSSFLLLSLAFRVFLKFLLMVSEFSSKSGPGSLFHELSQSS